MKNHTCPFSKPTRQHDSHHVVPEPPIFIPIISQGPRFRSTPKVGSTISIYTQDQSQVGKDFICMGALGPPIFTANHLHIYI